MVRLKGIAPSLLFLFRLISIPYGAIKSITSSPFSPFMTTFQFLMVRLKALTPCIVKFILRISIPYGAIKSITFDF